MRTSRANWVLATGAVILVIGLSVPWQVSASGNPSISGVSGGKVVTAFKGGGQVLALAIQNDHKIVAAGYSGQKSTKFALTRYNPDGGLDTSFGTNGKVITQFPGRSAAEDVAIQQDGKIVAAGSVNDEDFAVARYMPDGRLDRIFGAGGKVVASPPDGALVLAHSLLIQSDGRIVVGGEGSISGGAWFQLARFRPNGFVDTTFGEHGWVSTYLGNRHNPAGVTALTIGGNGNIVAAGYAGQNYAIARYKPDGILDTGFGTAGTVLSDFHQRYVGESFSTGLGIQPSGKIVFVASSHHVGTSSDFALARYNPDGTLDPSFGTHGEVLTDFGGSTKDYAEALAIQPNGKIVVAGSSRARGSRDFAVARYKPNGTLGPTFGRRGKVLTDFSGSGSEDAANALGIQSNGKIVAGGSSGSKFALARYLRSGTLDPSFGDRGPEIGAVDATVEMGSTPRAPGSTRNARPRQGSNPRWLTDVNGTLFFGANDRVHGLELWESDGTASGTVMVKDIDPQPGGSDPEDLMAVGDTLFFTAHDGVHGYELWKSDGTEAGTVMVKDINPGPDASTLPWLSRFAEVNGALFFTADDGVHGQELWTSDGTEAGTVMVKNILVGAGGSIPDCCGWFRSVNGTLYFAADDGTHGEELWRSDGTEAGTVMVRDVHIGPESSILPWLSGLASADGTVFFGADDGVHGVELWKSDGTETGTVMVKDIRRGGGNSIPIPIADINGALFFAAIDRAHGCELWKSDGTTTGTLLVKDINPGWPGWAFSCDGVVGPTAAGGENLFFAADDGEHGQELWKSDGTEAGTVMVKDIDVGAIGSIAYCCGAFTFVHGTLYFPANDGVHGRELWKSDGTGGGTAMIKVINPGRGNSNPQDVTLSGGTVFFTAKDDVHGRELWKTDGTPTGTVMVKDITPGGSHG